MGAVTARAEQIRDALLEAGAFATCDVRKLGKPGFLVIPIPTYEAPTLDNGYVVTWTVMAIIPGALGDLAAARQLEDLVAIAFRVLDVDEADPGSYQLPSNSDPSPAYTFNLSDSLAASESPSS